MTPTLLAARMDLSVSWASRLMNGQRGLGVGQFLRICEVFGVDPAAVFDAADDGTQQWLAVWVRLPADRRRIALDVAEGMLKGVSRPPSAVGHV